MKLHTNEAVHPVHWGDMEDQFVFESLRYYSKVQDCLVYVEGVEPNFEDHTWTDQFLVQASNIIDPKITFRVARVEWSDMPGGVSSWDNFVIWMDGGIKDECLLSYDYLVEFGDDDPQLEPIQMEMKMKGFDYLWLV